ncbi:MAG: hypothetical protein ACE5E4_13430 [Candidatus Binatia bacterium]
MAGVRALEGGWCRWEGEALCPLDAAFDLSMVEVALGVALGALHLGARLSLVALRSCWMRRWGTRNRELAITDYAAHGAADHVIASGMHDSTCKQLVSQRLKTLEPAVVGVRGSGDDGPDHPSAERRFESLLPRRKTVMYGGPSGGTSVAARRWIRR